MLTFGSCITFVLSVHVSSLAKISADAVARWVTLAAVEKVGRYRVTFQDCCKNVIMQTSTSSVWDDERSDLWFSYTLLGFRSLQKVVGMTDGGSDPSGEKEILFTILIHAGPGAHLTSSILSTSSLSWG
jgi:D-serine dehydratase